jgi:hypothetical protein
MAGCHNIEVLNLRSQTPPYKPRKKTLPELRSKRPTALTDIRS